MISIHAASNRIFSVISSSVGLKSCLIKIILIFCVGEGSGKRLQFFNIFNHFFSSFPFLLCLFFQLFLSYSIPDGGILIFFFSLLNFLLDRLWSLLLISLDILITLLTIVNIRAECCFVQGGILFRFLSRTERNILPLSVIFILNSLLCNYCLFFMMTMIILYLLLLILVVPAQNISHFL